ncbi:MAG: hypothetical protein AAF770_02075, partial [Bacteroidota bacterium]
FFIVFKIHSLCNFLKKYGFIHLFCLSPETIDVISLSIEEQKNGKNNLKLEVHSILYMIFN